MKVVSGTRCGFWRPPFDCVGIYVGPDIEGCSIHQLIEQPLVEGILRFRVGILFRNDLNINQKLEPILMLENFIPEMFNYTTWEKLNWS